VARRRQHHLFLARVVVAPAAADRLRRGRPSSTAIVGCDDANGSFVQLYSDDRGVHRLYQMTFGDGRWTLSRDGEPFAQRFVATLSADERRITGVWDRSEDGGFVVDFHLTYSRT
jgi:hypothetical protein